MVKVTFTLDDDTVATLRRSAERRQKPQSQIVREAIAEYAAHDDRMSAAEREEWLQAFDAHLRGAAPRSRRAVATELRELRASRRRGGRIHPVR